MKSHETTMLLGFFYGFPMVQITRGSSTQVLRHALPDTVAKALDGLSPALRLARAAARAAQRGGRRSSETMVDVGDLPFSIGKSPFSIGVN